MPSKKALRVGLISDTHDRIDDHLEKIFDGIELVLHAGDIGPKAFAWLDERYDLRAVKGNNDTGVWNIEGLPGARVEVIDGLRVLMIHELGTVEHPSSQVEFLLAAEKPDLVLTGHSHKPRLAEKDGVLYVNPGSVGPKRFSLPRVAGWLELTAKELTVTLFDLEKPKLTTPFERATYPRRRS
jgi:putative phosphoesterase